MVFLCVENTEPPAPDAEGSMHAFSYDAEAK